MGKLVQIRQTQPFVWPLADADAMHAHVHLDQHRLKVVGEEAQSQGHRQEEEEVEEGHQECPWPKEEVEEAAA